MRRELLPLLLVLVSCASIAPPTVDSVVADRLYCGRSIPDGSSVSDEQWNAFLREVVTPRFPDGFTVYRAGGQWREGTEITRETVMVIEILHPYSASLDRLVAAVAQEYRTRFRQSAVLRVSLPARMELIAGE